MIVFEWIVWGVACLIFLSFVLAAFSSRDSGLRAHHVRHSLLIAVGLVITFITQMSKLHLLWWVPVTFILNQMLSMALLRTKMRHLETNFPLAKDGKRNTLDEEETSFPVTEGGYQSVINTQIDLYNILRRRIPELPEAELLNKLISSRINALPKAGSDEQEYYGPLLGNHNKSLEDVIYAMIHYEFILSRASEAITKGQEMGLTSDQINELWGDFREQVRNDIKVSIQKTVANESSS